MLPNKLPEIVNSIRDHLFPGEKTPYRAGKILWIIRKYIKYTLLAAINGYPSGPRRKGKFILVYRYWDYIPWTIKKRLIFSSKAYGYEFKLYFFSKVLKKYNYYFMPEAKMKREIREFIETENVYKLIS